MLRNHGVFGLVVGHLPNLRYLTGFTGSNGLLLLTSRHALFVTDGRYSVQALQEVRGVEVKIAPGSLLNAIGQRLRALGRAKVAIEGNSLTINQKTALAAASGTKSTLVCTSGLVEQLRCVKDSKEITRIRGAAKLICRVFNQVLPLIRPGIRENELAAEIDYQMRKLGASGPAFETIVASGPRTALPHARPTQRRLRKNELVLLDMGAILGGYCSDLTRTVYLGKAPEAVRTRYHAVLQAHGAACRSVRAGATAGDVDKAARTSLAEAALDEFFVHSTGHGIGLEIHEHPRVAKGQPAKLQAGNVITIEPGIYLPGIGGIRIEDDVLVTPKGSQILTPASRELLQL